MPALHARALSRLEAHAVRRWGAAVALLALAAILPGCGAAAKHNFMASADAICAGTVRATRSIAPPNLSGGPTHQLAALNRYVTVILAVVQSEANQFRALRRSTLTARERAALASYLGALTETIGGYRDLAAAARHDDPQGVASAEAALRESRVAAVAARYGLRSCGVAGATVT